MDKAVPDSSVSQLDKEIWEWHNRVRKDPKCLKPDLEALLEKFDGMLLKRQGKVTLRTKEGAEAVQTAIQFLEQ